MQILCLHPGSLLQDSQLPDPPGACTWAARLKWAPAQKNLAVFTCALLHTGQFRDLPCPVCTSVQPQILSLPMERSSGIPAAGTLIIFLVL